MPIREMYSLLGATSRAIRHPLLLNGARHRLLHSNSRIVLSAHDPFGEDSPLGPELKRMQQQMLENPELLSSVMDSPMMQQMMQNPEMFGRMIQMHPQMATVLEQNPQLKAMMANPQLLRQAMEAMRDPEKLKAALNSVGGVGKSAATGDSAAEAAGDSAEEFDASAGVHDAAFRDVGPREKNGGADGDADSTRAQEAQTATESFADSALPFVDPSVLQEPAVMRDAIHRLAALQGQAAPPAFALGETNEADDGEAGAMQEGSVAYSTYLQAVGLAGQPGMADEAARYFEEAIRLAPDFAPARLQLAELLRSRARGDDEQQAERHLRAVLELLPGHAPARLQLGYLYLAKDKFAEAAPQLAEAAKYLPLWGDAYRPSGVPTDTRAMRASAWRGLARVRRALGAGADTATTRPREALFDTPLDRDWIDSGGATAEVLALLEAQACLCLDDLPPELKAEQEAQVGAVSVELEAAEDAVRRMQQQLFGELVTDALESDLQGGAIQSYEALRSSERMVRQAWERARQDTSQGGDGRPRPLAEAAANDAALLLAAHIPVLQDAALAAARRLEAAGAEGAALAILRASVELIADDTSAGGTESNVEITAECASRLAALARIENSLPTDLRMSVLRERSADVRRFLTQLTDGSTAPSSPSSSSPSSPPSSVPSQEFPDESTPALVQDAARLLERARASRAQGSPASLLEARALFEQVLQMVESPENADIDFKDCHFLAHCDLGGVLVELAELDLAQHHLTAALQLSVSAGASGAKIVAVAGLRAVKQAGGAPGVELAPLAAAVLDEVRRSAPPSQTTDGGGAPVSGEADALFELGSAHLADGNSAAAVEALREVVEIEPAHLTAHVNLANAYIVMHDAGDGDGDDSAKHLDLALEHSERVLNAPSALAEDKKRALLLQAACSRRRSDEDEAYDLLQRAVLLTPTPDPQALCEAADICIKKQDFKRATEHLRTATGWGTGASEASGDMAAASMLWRSGRARLVLSGLLQVQGELADALAVSSDTLRLREQGRLELNEQQVTMLHTFQSELRKQMETTQQ